jgi:hypothetical protein
MQKMGKRGFLGILVVCCLCLTGPSPGAEEAQHKPRVYADPEGRYSFPLWGDWIAIRGEAQKGVIGSFLFTRRVARSRKIFAEMLISTTESGPGLRLDDYVRVEHRRLTNSPGFVAVGQQEVIPLGGQRALKNRYHLSLPGQTGKEPKRAIHQYYTLRDRLVWGITLSARSTDEPVLGDIQQHVLSGFQFSVPEGASSEPPLEVFKKVSVTGAAGGFSLSVPEKWEASQSDEEGAALRGSGIVVHAFSVAADEKTRSAQDEAGAFLKERENLKDLQVLSQAERDIAGSRGYVVEYLGAADGRKWRARLTVFVDAARVFYIHCVLPAELWQTNQEIVERVSDSLSLESLPEEEAKE